MRTSLGIGRPRTCAGSRMRRGAGLGLGSAGWPRRADRLGSDIIPKSKAVRQRSAAGELRVVATTNDLKNGMTLDLDGTLWNVVGFQHVKPGKGGAFVRTTLKNVLTGKVVDKTFNAGVKVEVAGVDKREMQYSYKDGDEFVFMDTETYDMLHISAATVGDAANYLLENTLATVAIHEGSPLYVELPVAAVLEVTHTEPGLQGDRSTGGTKPATLETGAEIKVPLFITTGEKVKVDTRSGEYLGRG